MPFASNWEQMLERRRVIKDYYFTFGFGQKHENCYTVITAKDEQEARTDMVRAWGTEWSMCYTSAELAGVEEFHLRKI